MASVQHISNTRISHILNVNRRTITDIPLFIQFGGFIWKAHPEFPLMGGILKLLGEGVIDIPT